MANNPVLQGIIEIMERRYTLKVVNSDYVKIDERLNRYNMMLEVIMEPTMLERFRKKYSGKDTAMHVVWSFYKDTVRFNAEIGNNIILLLDSLLTDDENNKEENAAEDKQAEHA